MQTQKSYSEQEKKETQTNNLTFNSSFLFSSDQAYNCNRTREFHLNSSQEHSLEYKTPETNLKTNVTGQDVIAYDPNIHIDDVFLLDDFEVFMNDKSKGTLFEESVSSDQISKITQCESDFISSRIDVFFKQPISLKRLHVDEIVNDRTPKNMRRTEQNINSNVCTFRSAVDDCQPLVLISDLQRKEIPSNNIQVIKQCNIQYNFNQESTVLCVDNHNSRIMNRPEIEIPASEYSQKTADPITDELHNKHFVNENNKIIDRIKTYVNSEDTALKNIIKEFLKIYPCNSNTSHNDVNNENNYEKLIILLNFYDEIYILVEQLKKNNTNYRGKTQYKNLELGKYNTHAFGDIDFYDHDKFIISLLNEIKYNDLVFECILNTNLYSPQLPIKIFFCEKRYKFVSLLAYVEKIINLLNEDKPNLYIAIQQSVKIERFNTYFIFNYFYDDLDVKPKKQYIILLYIMKEIDIQTVFHKNLTKEEAGKMKFAQIFVDSVNQEISKPKDTTNATTSSVQNNGFSFRNTNQNTEDCNNKIDIYSDTYINEEERTRGMVEWETNNAPPKNNSIFSKIEEYLNMKDYYNDENITNLIFQELVNLMKNEDTKNLKNHLTTILKLFNLFYYRFVLEYIESIKQLKNKLDELKKPAYDIIDLIEILKNEKRLNKLKTQFRIVNYLVYSLIYSNKNSLNNYKTIINQHLDNETSKESSKLDKYIYTLFFNGAWYENFFIFHKQMESFNFTYGDVNQFSRVYKSTERLNSLMLNMKLYFKVQCDFIWTNKGELKFKIGCNCKILYHKKNVYCFVLYKSKDKIVEYALNIGELQDFMLKRDLENYLDEIINEMSRKNKI